MGLTRNLFLLLFLSTGCGLLASAYWNLPIELTLLGIAAAAAAAYFGVRYPEWFLVASLFAPQWKTAWGLQTINHSIDLTVAMLLCLAAGLLWRLLTRLGREGHPDLSMIFWGQLNQILAFSVFAAIIAASYFYTSAPDYGGSKLIRFLLIGTLLLIAPFLIILNEEDFRHFVKIFVGFSAFTAIQIVGMLETRNQDTNEDITRIGAGWLMGMAILLVLFYPMSRNRRVQQGLLLFLVPVFIAGLIATAARGPILALSIAGLIGLATLLKQRQLQRSTAILLLFFLVAGVGGSYYVLRQADLTKYSGKTGELKLLVTEGATSGSSAKRMDFYRTTISAIPDHPVFGSGIGSWSTFYFGNDARNYPHNLFIEIAFEEGLVGLGAFLVFLGFVAVSTVRMLEVSRSHFLVLGLMVVYCLIVSMFSGDLDDNRVLWFWIGMTLTVCRVVELKIREIRFAQRTIQATPGRGFYRPRIPAFSRQFLPNRYSVSRKGSTWGEKFVS